MNDPPKDKTPHPDFDGHLEYPLLQMTPKQRLDWAWQMLLLKRQGEQERMKSKSPIESPDS